MPWLATCDVPWRRALGSHGMPFPAEAPIVGSPAAPHATKTRSRRPPTHRIGASRRVFDSLARSTVQLALWQRGLPEGLARPVANPEEANRAIVKRAAGVRRARAGDVLLMKGVLGGGAGLVHRSPPIEALGMVRVVLVVSV